MKFSERCEIRRPRTASAAPTDYQQLLNRGKIRAETAQINLGQFNETAMNCNLMGE